jgi:hypothetical protein
MKTLAIESLNAGYRIVSRWSTQVFPTLAEAEQWLEFHQQIEHLMQEAGED